MSSRVSVTAFLRQHGPRYIFVSLFFAIVSNVFLIGFDMLGLHYGLAIITCGALCIPSAYIAQSFLTFAVPLDWTVFCRYAAIQTANIPLSFIAIYILHDLLQMKMFWVAPLSTCLMFFWNYTSSRWVMHFRRSN